VKPADVKYLVVHCSATPPEQDIGAKELDRMHRERGFLKIGYHFVIRRNGNIESGRSVDEVGAHVEGHNHESLGICMVGGVAKESHVVRDGSGSVVEFKAQNNFTPEQFATLHSLLKQMTTPYTGAETVYPTAEILGHRDFPNVHKDCPSFDVRSWWAEVKEE
jgi:N-acetylmuramoyl-L-alanine amidase